MIRMVGDVHGMVNNYVELVHQCDYSLQIGDMGFDYTGLKILDYERHKFIGGNHDNYDEYYTCPYALGDYGIHKAGNFECFYIRGAFSIDVKQRLKHEQIYGVKSWWEQEQLNINIMASALKQYELVKPKIMVTHTCPTKVARLIGNPGALKAFGFDPDTFGTNTQHLLQECFKYHQPDVWVYGHFHQNRTDIVNGTKFICLDELSFLDFTEEGEIVDYI